MGKNKIHRFEENKTFMNFFQPLRDEVISGYEIKGNWRKKIFKNENPIILELGCGKGEYTIEMAEAFPEKNFIGIDIKGARMWFGAKYASENKLQNVAFIRTQIELIEYIFYKNEVDEIWITFPDPQIKFKRTKHRLTNIEFLQKYKNIIKQNGKIHLKTDSEFLHGYTLGLLQTLGYNIEAAHHDIYSAPEFESDMIHLRGIKTHYEKLFYAKNKAISYIRAELTNN